jgi:hypothetical protein
MINKPISTLNFFLIFAEINSLIQYSEKLIRQKPQLKDFSFEINDKVLYFNTVLVHDEGCLGKCKFL